MVHHWLHILVLLIIVVVGYAMEQIHRHIGNVRRNGGKVMASSSMADQNNGSLSHIVMQEHSTLDSHDAPMSEVLQVTWSGVQHFPTKSLLRRETHGHTIQGPLQQREQAPDFAPVGDISPLNGAGQNGLMRKTKRRGHPAQRQQAAIISSFASTEGSFLEHADNFGVSAIPAVIPDASVSKEALEQKSFERKHSSAYTAPLKRNLKRNTSNDMQRHRQHRDRAMLSSDGDVIPLDSSDGPSQSEPQSFPVPSRKDLLRKEGKHKHEHPRMRQPPQHGQNDFPNRLISVSISEQPAGFLTAPTVVPTAVAAMLTPTPETSPDSSQGEPQTASPVMEPAQSADGGSSWPMLFFGVFLGIVASCVTIVLWKKGWKEQALGMQAMPTGSRSASPNSYSYRPSRTSGPEMRSPETSTTIKEARSGSPCNSAPLRPSSLKKSKSSLGITRSDKDMHSDNSPVTSPVTSPTSRSRIPKASTLSRSNSESSIKQRDSSPPMLPRQALHTYSPERTTSACSSDTPQSQSKSSRTKFVSEGARSAMLGSGSNARLASASPEREFAI